MIALTQILCIFCFYYVHYCEWIDILLLVPVVFHIFFSPQDRMTCLTTFTQMSVSDYSMRLKFISSFFTVDCLKSPSHLKILKMKQNPFLRFRLTQIFGDASFNFSGLWFHIKMSHCFIPVLEATQHSQHRAPQFEHRSTHVFVDGVESPTPPVMKS